MQQNHPLKPSTFSVYADQNRIHTVLCELRRRERNLEIFTSEASGTTTGTQNAQNTHESQNAAKSPTQNCRFSARIPTEIRIQTLRAPKARAEKFGVFRIWNLKSTHICTHNAQKTHTKGILEQDYPLKSEHFRRTFRPNRIRSLRAPKARAEKFSGFSHLKPGNNTPICTQNAPNTYESQNAAKSPTKKLHIFGAYPHQKRDPKGCERRRREQKNFGIFTSKAWKNAPICTQNVRNTHGSQNASKSPTKKSLILGAHPD